ncbi:hypothetical protein [Micromonospora sp. KC723]|uniref:hypothetical protein n=1 Tax=Micromonospora sp. KC723 TaxID=2530381 RepID=UPI001404F727|nr:hypothetical protein [Micromonospora sp. KC723]
MNSMTRSAAFSLGSVNFSPFFDGHFGNNFPELPSVSLRMRRHGSSTILHMLSAARPACATSDGIDAGNHCPND